MQRWAMMAMLVGAVASQATAQTTQPDTMVRIGVWSYRVPAQTVAEWQPTAEYLSRRIPGYLFQIVPLEAGQMNQAVARRQVDFIITNPANYVELEHDFGATRIATLVESRTGKTYRHYASAIFVRAGRTDLKGLEDLRGKSFIAWNEHAFGGWWMAWREFKSAGMDPAHDLASLKFVEGEQDNVVYAVRDGQADAGTVRADLLVQMAAEGKIDLAAFRVLEAKPPKGDFPFARSTRLYPGWPIASAAHTANDLSEEVAIALLAMPATDPAASAAHSAGWTVPMNYSPVHELMKELRLGPYQDHEQVTVAMFVRQHWHWVVAALALLALLAAAAYTRFNRKLVRMREAELRRAREDAEHIRSANRALRMISQSNQVLVHAADEPGLLSDICTVAVDLGGYPLVWVGRALKDAEKSVRPVAWAGRGCEYLQHVKCSWADNDLGRGPTGTAIRSGLPSVCQDLAAAPNFALWRDQARHRGFGSSIALPLICDGATWGALMLYREQAGAFADDEIKLLAELASDVAYGIKAIHTRQELGRTKDDLERRVNERTADLERSNRDLAQFAYVASHDLQEPLRVIVNFLQLLDKRHAAGLNDEAKDFVGRTVRAARRMQDMITDLLAYARVGAQGQPFEQVDCNRAVEDAMANLQAEIARVGGAVTRDGLPTVLADASQLAQVFQNLVSNGLKFHGQLPPEVHVSAARGGGEWIISVRDNGIGIEPQHAERVFVIFERLHAQPSGHGTPAVPGADYEGTGIGLALCKRIVERHGGRIWFDSEPGKGTTFHFTLPDRRV